MAGFPLVSDNEHIIKYSEFLEQILGFGISAKLPFKGKFFYQSCYQLGSENVEYGKVHYGGQRETMLVEPAAFARLRVETPASPWSRARF